jgi:UDP-3-O-[3-hydroxymyristoyl] glucosamine N-acyltransferase
VTLGEESSVWFGATLRGDINAIRIGARSNIQDGVVVHVADAFGAQIGELVTVGHNAIVHACTIEDEVLVGMGAIVMDGALVGTRLDYRGWGSRDRRNHNPCWFAGSGFAGQSDSIPVSPGTGSHSGVGAALRHALQKLYGAD